MKLTDATARPVEEIQGEIGNLYADVEETLESIGSTVPPQPEADQVGFPPEGVTDELTPAIRREWLARYITHAVWWDYLATMFKILKRRLTDLNKELRAALVRDFLMEVPSPSTTEADKRAAQDRRYTGNMKTLRELADQADEARREMERYRLYCRYISDERHFSRQGPTPLQTRNNARDAFDRRSRIKR